MATTSECLQGVGLLLVAFVTTSINVPLMIYLSRSGVVGEDVVAKAMRSLAVSDLVLGSVTTVIGAGFAWKNQQTSIPAALLTFQGSLWQACLITTIYHLALMSALKCYIIVRPLTYHAVLTTRFLNIVVAAIWSGAGVMMAGAYLAGVRWIMDTYIFMAVPFANLAAGRGLRLLQLVFFVIPSVVMVVAYARILIIVRRHHIAIGAVFASSSTADQNAGYWGWRASIRSARSLFIISVAYYLNYVPIEFNGLGLALPVWVLFLTRWMLLFSAPVNGLLYILLYKSAGRDMRHMFCRCRSSKSIIVPTVSTVVNVASAN